MPFASQAQRRFMYAKHPRIARRWTKEEKMAKADSPSLVEIRKAGFLPKTVIRSAPAPHMKSWQHVTATRTPGIVGTMLGQTPRSATRVLTEPGQEAAKKAARGARKDAKIYTKRSGAIPQAKAEYARQKSWANAPTPARSYEPDNRLPWED